MKKIICAAIVALAAACAPMVHPALRQPTQSSSTAAKAPAPAAAPAAPQNR